MKQSFVDKVLDLQDETYSQLIRDPRVSGLFDIHQPLGLTRDLLPIISSFEGKEHFVYKAFKEEVARLKFPANEYELEAYKNHLNKIDTDIKMNILIVAKLNSYVNSLQGLMTNKIARHSGFFDSAPELYTKLTSQIEAVNYFIKYLLGDKKVQFSSEAIDLLSKGFVSKTLAQSNVRLTELPRVDNGSHAVISPK